MAMLKQLIRDGRAVGLVLLVAVACSPAAAAVLPAAGERFADEHAAGAGFAVDATPLGSDAAATAEVTSDVEDSQDASTNSAQDASTEPTAEVADAPATGADARTADTEVNVSSDTSAKATNTTTTDAIGAGAAASPLAATSQLSVSATAATLTVATAPHVTCAITVSAAGRVPGLDAKQSDASGHIVWTWAISGGMTGAARVECTTSGQSIVLTPKAEPSDIDQLGRAQSDQHEPQTRSGDHVPTQVPPFAKDAQQHGGATRR